MMINDKAVYDFCCAFQMDQLRLLTSPEMLSFEIKKDFDAIYSHSKAKQKHLESAIILIDLNTTSIKHIFVCVDIRY